MTFRLVSMLVPVSLVGSLAFADPGVIPTSTRSVSKAIPSITRTASKAIPTVLAYASGSHDGAAWYREPAGNPAKSADKKDDAPPKPEVRDYTEFSNLIHKIVVAQIPKVIEDNSGWGQTVPIPDKLRLPGLRVTMKVNGKDELPHGLWRKVKVWLDDPAKDLDIAVRDFKLENKACRLTLAAKAPLHTWAELQTWQKGLALVGGTIQADVRMGLVIDCDVAVALDTKKFPPELKINPKVTGLKTELTDIALRQVTARRLGVVLQGDAAKDFGNQFKGILQDALRTFEPRIKDLANQSIAKALEQGKGNLSAGALLKALGPAADQ